ncbi:MAG: MmgE/PrpD family protein, partial [Clostridiales bacterium]|nr:MmgE/PrpD family protein [Clostridiales bacterium]
MQSKMLSDYVLSIRFDDLPQAAVETGKMCVEDLLGVALSASRRPEAKIWETYFLDDPRTQQSAVWKAGFACIGFREAAGLNAALGHMLDMDDVHNSSITHLGTVTIPAAIAVG